MEKKGSIHIDWIVSVALFMTFIIIIFGFIKPGYEPVFEGDVLIKLVSDEFNSKAEWEVYKTMLSFDCDTKGVINLGLSPTYIPVGDKYKLLLQNGNVANYNGNLIDLPNNNYNFWIIHNSDIGYNSDNLGLEDDGPEDPKNCQINAANPIVFKGINEGELDLVNLDVNTWDFPDFRYFRLKVLNPSGSYYDNRYCFAKLPSGDMSGNTCDNYKIPDEVEVYSSGLGKVILDKDLNQNQVILNIEVW
ncbi:MAG: hypothetical protein CMH63_02240 [Nanoarchaeota archaeon]|nr:hypothetical protein [Nanoarchaeota archaeon]